MIIWLFFSEANSMTDAAVTALHNDDYKMVKSYFNIINWTAEAVDEFQQIISDETFVRTFCSSDLNIVSINTSFTRLIYAYSFR